MTESAVRDHPLVFVTGAPRYIGDRLVPELVEILPGDTADRVSLIDALRGIDVAYYLIHSLGAGPEFESLDGNNAQNFATAAFLPRSCEQQLFSARDHCHLKCLDI